MGTFLNKTMGRFLLGMALAVGLVAATAILSKAAVRVARNETIRVKGAASKLVTSDFGCWNGEITLRSPDLDTGTKKLAEQRQAVLLYLNSAGFQDAEITVEGIGIRQEFKLNEKGQNTGEVRAFVLSQSFQINSGKVNSLEKLSRDFSQLLEKGILVTSSNAEFIVNDLESYKMELLKQATQNAYQRADVIARGCEGKVGRLLSASQGVFQVLAPGIGNISDYGTYDKGTVNKEVRAVVTLEFQVDHSK